MATSKNTTNSRTPKKKSSVTKTSATKTSATKTQKSIRSAPSEDTESIWSKLWSCTWGKVIYLIAGILILIGLDLLIAMNKYDLFFMVLGVEIIVAMLISWVVFLIIDRRRRFSEDSEE